MLFRTVGVFSVGSGIKRECEGEMEKVSGRKGDGVKQGIKEGEREVLTQDL